MLATRRIDIMSCAEWMKYQAEILDEQSKNGKANEFILYDTDDEMRCIC